MQPETQQWYGGVLVTSTRELEPEERLGLAEMRREMVAEVRNTVLLIVLFAALIIATASIGRAPFAAVLLVVVLWRLRTRLESLRAQMQFIRASKRDLAEGGVGICGEHEVLLASGLVWKYKGARQHTITLLTRATTAPVPEHARLAMNYVKPFDNNVSVHQRPLSDAEVRELATYAPDLPWVRAMIGVLTIGAAIVALSNVPPYPAVVFASVAICVFITWRIGRGLAAVMRTRRDVQRDVAERYVVIVRRTDDQQLFEVLPHSHYVWTEDGEPAGWRRT